MKNIGVLDYAGGNVVHIASGASGLATVILALVVLLVLVFVLALVLVLAADFLLSPCPCASPCPFNSYNPDFLLSL